MAGTLALTLHPSIAELGAAEWDACAGSANPFVSHAFLSAVEESGSAGPRTGWMPLHAALRDGTGRLLACTPMYVKAHSWGEYVFDQGWADAYERAGGRYYPKLQVAVPFSPVPGPRLLVRPDVPDAAALRSALAGAIARVCEKRGFSSAHVTFCTEAEWHALKAEGWLGRMNLQFHWRNEGYRTFDDFLAALSSRKRKQIRKERARAAEGLCLRTLRGAEITPAHWDAFFRFYRATVDRKWGQAYLTRRFFPLLGERLGEKVVLMWAEQEGRPVAGALNLLGADTLYGRNWGALIDQPFLHFELCYYRAVEFAIAHGLARVEAGAQGAHKVSRGYLPVPTFSAHWIVDPGLRRAVAEFLGREVPAVERKIAAIAAEASPFREDREG
jgi:hypothetical protein